MSEKRVKAGIALTPKHLKLCDENLTRAGIRSRNSFVERAIEFYVNYLLTQELPQLHRDGFDTNRFETLCKSLGTGQYKMAVELATVARLLSTILNTNSEELRWIREDSAQEVKNLEPSRSAGSAKYRAAPSQSKTAHEQAASRTGGRRRPNHLIPSRSITATPTAMGNRRKKT